MKKDDSLITAASVTPDPDQGCASTCYYVGWEWDHEHGGGGGGNPGPFDDDGGTPLTSG